MKKLIAIAVLLVTLNLNAETISHGRVTDKAIDPPRRQWYPFVGFVDINRNPVYWFKVDTKWHRVTTEEYGKYSKGQFFSRKTNHNFYPQF